MNPLTEILRNEIRRDGPISFHQFMQVALYDPIYGYYRRARDPFGKQGDFYTAEQLQPVFGVLIGSRIRSLYQQMGAPRNFTVVELGAGRREMASALSEWRYVPVDLEQGGLPGSFRGIVFCNEFFDALPVHAAVYQEDRFRELRVAWEGRFVWTATDPVTDEIVEYLRRYFPQPREETIFEINLDGLAWLERIAKSLEGGYVFTIDYGYTRAESVRFPRGTLMSYRRHQALENVLECPGERDITAHVNFSALEEHGARLGLHKARFESLSQTLLSAGEADQFAAALAAESREQELRRRLQLKTLLFGMGGTFRTLIQRAGGGTEDSATK